MWLNKFKFDRDFLFSAIKIAIPLMLQQVLVNCVGLVDNLMIGSLGNFALASVSAVNKYYMISTFAVFGIAAAASVFMAQYMGANNLDKLKQSFRFMLISTLILNVLFTIVSYFFKTNVVSYFSKDINVLNLGIKYLDIITFTFIPVAITISINNAIRTTGETKILLVISLFAIITNTFFNYCMIFGNFGFEAMGVKGAAIATLISRVLEMLLSILVIWIKKYEFNTKVFDIFKIDFEVSKNIFLKALPLCFNEILWAFGMATIFKVYSLYGVSVMAAMSMSSTITDIFFTLNGGMSIVTIVFVSKKLGANKLDEAKEYGYKMLGLSCFISLIFGAILYFSSNLLPFIYSNIDKNSINISQKMIRIQGLMFWVYMITTECYFIMRSGGDMKNTLIMDSGFMWVITIPLLYVASIYFNLDYLSLYIFAQFINILKLLFSYYLFSKDGWVVNLTS